MWHVNKPLRKEMGLYNSGKNSSDTAAIGQPESQHLNVSKFQTYMIFHIMHQRWKI
jgi:hypothetical protein